MTECTFVHAADLHLGAPFRGVSAEFASHFSASGASGRGTTLSSLLQEASFTALARLTRLCIEAGADFLLLAGDVYNEADSSLRARLALRDAFLELRGHGVQVFLAHGNHDPLAEEAPAIPWPDNVTVFGGTLSACTVFRGETPLALVHGVSHTNAKEGRNLARLFKRREPTLLEPDLFQIGLLHCALEGQSEVHARYAPCSMADLAAAGLDYWALGHVHAWRLMGQHGKEPRHPYAAYSGSLQGMHVNESGPHGCLLARVDKAGKASVRHIPLAPVQWETLTVALDAAPEDAIFTGREGPAPAGAAETGPADIPALLDLLAERLASLDPGARWPAEENPFLYPPEAVAVRLILRGRTGLDHALRLPGALEDLQRHLAGELEGTGVWVRDIALATQPLMDLEAIAERPDLAGETLRYALGLHKDAPALAAVAETALEPLFQRPRLRKILTPPEGEELALLAEEATLLCLDLLEGE